jgi:hypothetical protein
MYLAIFFCGRDTNQSFKNVSSKKEQIPYEKEQLALLEG